MSLGKSKVANVRDVDRDESHCGWMLAMIKVDFYKVKLNGLLSGEGCYQGGSISTADALACRCCEVCMVNIVPKLYLQMACALILQNFEI